MTRLTVRAVMRSPLARLHAQGYIVVPVAIPDGIIMGQGHGHPSSMCSLTLEQRAPLVGDPNRYRWTLLPHDRARVRTVLEHTSRVRGLHVPGLSFPPEGVYAIGNSSAALTPQMLHTDYPWTAVAHLRHRGVFPRSAILAVDAAFDIATRDCGTITVPPMHVIFLLASFWHGGGPHVSTWARYHGYELPEGVPLPDSVYT